MKHNIKLNIRLGLNITFFYDIGNALRSGDPAKYVSHFPIHQDGSCNGLQHYAALGRDEKGARSVNLSPSERPNDVYSTVLDIVERKRERDEASCATAALLRGHVKRKVIKQTVMTTVYNVTWYVDKRGTSFIGLAQTYAPKNAQKLEFGFEFSVF